MGEDYPQITQITHNEKHETEESRQQGIEK